eukprot:7736375-Pyramimonas_sp.AAC.1
MKTVRFSGPRPSFWDIARACIFGPCKSSTWSALPKCLCMLHVSTETLRGEALRWCLSKHIASKDSALGILGGD